LAGIPNKNTQLIDECFFTDKLDLVERYILYILHSDILAENPAVAFLTAFLNASLIFIYDDLRECPKWTNICIALSERIHSGLHMTDLSSVEQHCPDLLIWIYLLGRSGNSPLDERGKAWYRNRIADMEDTFGIVVPPTVTGLRYLELLETVKPNEERK
jgi:hypothetical protein